MRDWTEKRTWRSKRTRRSRCPGDSASLPIDDPARPPIGLGLRPDLAHPRCTACIDMVLEQYTELPDHPAPAAPLGHDTLTRIEKIHPLWE